MAKSAKGQGKIVGSQKLPSQNKGRSDLKRIWLRPENVRLIRMWRIKNLTTYQIAKRIGVAYETLMHWARENENLCNALNYSRELANSMALHSLLDQIERGNITAIIFYLKNQMPEDFGERKDYEKESLEKLDNIIKSLRGQ